MNLTVGQERLIHVATKWAYEQLSLFSPEELLTAGVLSHSLVKFCMWYSGMGLAMLECLGLEDMRTIASAFRVKAKKALLDVYVDQFIALTLLFPQEYRSDLHETAFGEQAAASILSAHHDRQAQIAVGSSLQV